MSIWALIVASPIAMAAPHELLYADYEGTVTAIATSPDNPHFVGEHIQGRLTIDVTLAEQVRNEPLPDLPNARSYGLDQPFDSPDFVTGFTPVRPIDAGRGTDTVGISLRDTRGPTGQALDTYSIQDDIGWYAYGIELGVTGHNLFDTLDIRQSFDLKASDLTGPGESMGGSFYQSREGLAAFMLSRLTLRPATCHAP